MCNFLVTPFCYDVKVPGIESSVVGKSRLFLAHCSHSADHHFEEVTHALEG